MISTFTVGLTGLPGAGKATLGRALKQALNRRNLPACIIDGDELRQGLCGDLGYTIPDRQETVRRAAKLAKLVNGSGVVAIVALISPLATQRSRAREIIGSEFMIEIHMHALLDVCQTRDPKGRYRLAKQGSLRGLTGLDAPYEPPSNPALVLDTSRIGIGDCTVLLGEKLYISGECS